MTRTLIEGEDFYYEGPYMVFTEKFLRERGYCCESGCRHCPYQRAEGSAQRREGTHGQWPSSMAFTSVMSADATFFASP